MNITDYQQQELCELFLRYRNSKQYEYRKGQTHFCNFARELIRYIVENKLFNENSATTLVHLFAVNAKKEYIITTIQSIVTDKDALNTLLSLLNECNSYGYTAVGKTKIELNNTQAKVVEQFLYNILHNETIEQIKNCIAEYLKKNIPNCTTGIYSPWLHYIHPTICPIANSALEPLLNYLGIPQNKKSDYLYMMELLSKIKEKIGAEDYSILDDFLFYFDNPNDKKPHKPRYWVFNHKYEGATAEDKKELRDEAITYNYAFMQYEYAHQTTAHVTMNWRQALQVREGDYIFLKSDAVYAVGRAIRPKEVSTIKLNASKIIKAKSHGKYLSGKCHELITFEDAEVFYENLTDGNANEWGQRIDVDSWQFYNPHGIWLHTEEYLGGTNYDTIREISENEGKRLINKLYMGLGMKAQILKQLKECKNIILTGAPGTGKTYMAKQVARLMLFGKSEDNELNANEKALYKQHVEFVQFHPNYDYSDFVEGLRPIKSEDNSTLGFERKDGIFKDFCKRALANEDVTLDNFDVAWDVMLKELDDKDYIDIELISKKGTFRIELNEYGTGLANRTYPNNKYEKGQWIEGKSKFFSKEQLRNIYQGGNGVPHRGHDNYRRAILEHMKKYFNLKEYSTNNKTNKEKLPFIMIIDEINRGEMSKILGELFYSIDPGYRGEDGRVKTQYQNLIEDEDIFAQGFYVPENVYIIGTMNDIDRSVESMDFAIRRRFAWQEILASDTEDSMLSLLDENIQSKAKESMERLNDAILDPDMHLGTAYQIGASYFLRLRNNPNFEDLWEHQLKGVLYEYFRGQREIETKINTLHEAFIG